MIQTVDMQFDPKTAAAPHLIKNAVSKQLGIGTDRVVRIDILRRSIDARQRKIVVNLRLRVHVDNVENVEAYKLPDYRKLPQDAPVVVVVGAGPAGLFAALKLIEYGVRPIVLERGKDVDSRRKDLAEIARSQTVNPDSNYSFGEGGAGAYSDGKLYTRSKKRGNVDEILHVLHAHGAPDDILIDAHPHIGTNLLPEIIKRIRNTIIEYGGEVRFCQHVERLLYDSDAKRVEGVETADGRRYYGPVILAIGHSARDTYRQLLEQGVTLEAKGLAVGVRLEHPSHLIDCIQYKSPEGRGKYLPAAEYSMLTRVYDRAVYSFCMCPGGVIVPAATAPGQLVVNGMSPSNRGSRWSNSGMVVEVLPEDIPGDDPLRLMRFQRDIELRFSNDALGTQNAPAQRMTDFVSGRKSVTLPDTSYAPGIHSARVDTLLPVSVSDRLKEAFKEFGRRYPGFLTDKATVIGAETRTSAPVRITRHHDTLVSISTPGLYPAGEGAGYAGGIVSAAIDGCRCAQAVARDIKK